MNMNLSTVLIVGAVVVALVLFSGAINFDVPEIASQDASGSACMSQYELDLASASIGSIDDDSGKWVWYLQSSDLNSANVTEGTVSLTARRTDDCVSADGASGLTHIANYELFVPNTYKSAVNSSDNNNYHHLLYDEGTKSYNVTIDGTNIDDQKVLVSTVTGGTNTDTLAISFEDFTQYDEKISGAVGQFTLASVDFAGQEVEVVYMKN